MQHAITYALIEIDDPKATAPGLGSPAAATRRTAMIALDQMDGGRLNPRSVAEWLSSGDRPLAEAASWIVGRHPEWAGDLADVLGARLSQADLAVADRSELERQLGRFARWTPIQHLLAARLSDSSAPPATRLSCLEAMSLSGLKPEEVPSEWVSALAIALGEWGAGRSPAGSSPARGGLGRATPADRSRALGPTAWLLACSGSPAMTPTRRAPARRPGRRARWPRPARSRDIRLLDRTDRPGQSGGEPHDRGRRPARARLPRRSSIAWPLRWRPRDPWRPTAC